MQRSNTAKVHRRTRNDHAAETAEDYVEAIATILVERGVCRIVHLTEHFGVTHVTVIKILNRLHKEGLVQLKAQSPILLTAKGRALARRSKERHETVYQFLRAIGVPDRVAAEDAEGIEHHVSDATMARFRKVVQTGSLK
ncbi:MAG: transcriptional regulator [Candidatus Hydrogenedentes bacterium]|nr:transcriptional regulator [Candidatus Hydrogenedentota bacterium]